MKLWQGTDGPTIIAGLSNTTVCLLQATWKTRWRASSYPRHPSTCTSSTPMQHPSLTTTCSPLRATCCPPFPISPPNDSSLHTGSGSHPLHSSASSPGSHHASSQACQAPASDSQGPQAQDSQPPSSQVQGSQSLEQRVQAVDETMGRETMRSQQQRVSQVQQSQGFRAMPRNIWNLVASVVTDRLGTGDPGGFPSNCQPMCEERKEKDLRREQRALRRAFPLLDFSAAKSG